MISCPVRSVIQTRPGPEQAKRRFTRRPLGTDRVRTSVPDPVPPPLPSRTPRPLEGLPTDGEPLGVGDGVAETAGVEGALLGRSDSAAGGAEQPATRATIAVADRAASRLMSSS